MKKKTVQEAKNNIEKILQDTKRNIDKEVEFVFNENKKIEQDGYLNERHLITLTLPPVLPNHHRAHCLLLRNRCMLNMDTSYSFPVNEREFNEGREYVKELGYKRWKGKPDWLIYENAKIYYDYFSFDGENEIIIKEYLDMNNTRFIGFRAAMESENRNRNTLRYEGYLLSTYMEAWEKFRF